MALFQMTYGLNREGQEEIAAKARSTHLGMAHFAHSGPSGKTCRECRFWMKTSTWYAEMGKHGGAARPAPCAKYHQLMQLKGENIPHDAAACKYFEQAAAPQPLRRPKRASE